MLKFSEVMLMTEKGRKDEADLIRRNIRMAEIGIEHMQKIKKEKGKLNRGQRCQLAKDQAWLKDLQADLCMLGGE